MAQTAESTESFNTGPDGKLTPRGEQERWTMEFRAARDKLKKWHDQGEKVLDRYLDERDRSTQGESRLNLWTANVETQQALLYGKPPKSDVTRTFDDQDDDVARVAATMLERNLDHDIESTDDTYAEAIGSALEDRLIPGFGFATLRYEAEFGEATDPETGEPLADPETGKPIEKVTRENVATDWHYWKSVLWSPCRTFKTMRWCGWETPMTRAQVVKRFGPEGERVPLNAKTGKRGEQDAVRSDPWARVNVWEIWSKDDRKVYWHVEGHDVILDVQDDPLGLDGFFPFPRPLIARPTTRAFVPRPDFVIAQDLYNEIDKATTRINLLEDAVRVTGVYDKSAPEIARILTEAGVNKLYPAENWAALAEKGGIKGAVDWMPLEAIVAAIEVLTNKRAEKIGLLQQVTGWSDIMRGQSNANETLGAQKMKSAYGGVRVQKGQGEFAEFASGLKRIAAEIMVKHFDPKTLIERSNLTNTPDAEFVEAAAQLLKSGQAKFRIQVKPESINMTDYATLKQERTEAVTALGGLMSALTPLIQAGGPNAVEFALKTGAWLLAGVKGGESLEAEYDRFVKKAQALAAQPPAPPPPDPKLEATKVKGQVDIAKAKMDLQGATVKHQMDMQKLGAEVQANQANAAIRVAEAQATPPQPVVVQGGKP